MEAQVNRLRANVAGAAPEEIRRGARAWRRNATALGHVVTQLEDGRRGIDDQLGDNARAAAQASFGNAAQHSEQRKIAMSRGENALLDAARAIEDAQRELQALDSEGPPSAPTRPDGFATMDEADQIRAERAHGNAVSSYNSAVAAREERARLANEALERDLRSSSDVFREMNPERQTPTGSMGGSAGVQATPVATTRTNRRLGREREDTDGRPDDERPDDDRPDDGPDDVPDDIDGGPDDVPDDVGDETPGTDPGAPASVRPGTGPTETLAGPGAAQPIGGGSATAGGASPAASGTAAATAAAPVAGGAAAASAMAGRAAAVPSAAAAGATRAAPIGSGARAASSGTLGRTAAGAAGAGRAGAAGAGRAGAAGAGRSAATRSGTGTSAAQKSAQKSAAAKSATRAGAAGAGSRGGGRSAAANAARSAGSRSQMAGAAGGTRRRDSRDDPEREHLLAEQDEWLDDEEVAPGVLD